MLALSALFAPTPAAARRTLEFFTTNNSQPEHAQGVRAHRRWFRHLVRRARAARLVRHRPRARSSLRRAAAGPALRAFRETAASRVLMPRRRISFTSRSCSVRLPRSTRPLAWLELAHQMSMFSSNRARPNCVTPRPKSVESRVDRKMLALSGGRATSSRGHQRSSRRTQPRGGRLPRQAPDTTN